VRTPAAFRLLDVHVADGPAWFRIGDAAPHRLAGRSFALAPAGEPRRFSVRSPGRFLRLRLDPAALPTMEPALLAGVAVGRDPAVLAAADLVADRLEGREIAPRAAVAALVEALGAALARGPGAGLRAFEVEGCVARALDFIDRCFDKPITVDAVAAAADAPRQRLARRFRLATGVPIHEFILRRRVARAKSLLQSGGGTIADVAYAAGFGSQSHMTTHFRRRLGQTPGACARR
jgi:AraC family transcriptional regulator